MKFDPAKTLINQGFSAEKTAGASKNFEFCIHGQCDVRIGEERLTGWSTDGELQRALRGFLGTAVEEAALGAENVLRLRFPAGAIEFCPIPDRDEAWRLFSQDRARAHLVAAFSDMAFE